MEDYEDIPLGLPPEEHKLRTNIKHRSKLQHPELPEFVMDKPKVKKEPEIYVLSKDKEINGKSKRLF